MARDVCVIKARYKMLRAFLNMFSTEQVYPGEIYEFFDDDKSPFETRHKVEVIAIKDGWVNYRFLGGSMWQNESLRLGPFLFCYRRITPPAPEKPPPLTPVL